jgi:pRiA4b ORF-3-like protein
MAKKTPKIYQFKVTLAEVKPAIWRRIQVPEKYNFWDLHVAIQDAMGWEDHHLHEFKIVNPKNQEEVHIGIPDDDFDWSRATLPGWKIPVADYFTMENRSATYDYDFGDGWQHRVRLEEIEQAQPGFDYPRCLAGARACPPEDVGGTWGYEDFVHTINDPNHNDHERMLEWIGGSFDPEHFNPEEVQFDDPKKRWQFAIGGEDAA